MTCVIAGHRLESIANRDMVNDDAHYTETVNLLQASSDLLSNKSVIHAPIEFNAWLKIT